MHPRTQLFLAGLVFALLGALGLYETLAEFRQSRAVSLHPTLFFLPIAFGLWRGYSWAMLLARLGTFAGLAFALILAVGSAIDSRVVMIEIAGQPLQGLAKFLVGVSAAALLTLVLLWTARILSQEEVQELFEG